MELNHRENHHKLRVCVQKFDEGAENWFLKSDNIIECKNTPSLVVGFRYPVASARMQLHLHGCCVLCNRKKHNRMNYATFND